MINCLNTNFSRSAFQLRQVITNLQELAKTPESILEEDDVKNDNKFIYGVYKLTNPCVLDLRFRDALEFIYGENVKIVKPESVTRSAKAIGYRFNPHKAKGKKLAGIIRDVFNSKPELLDELNVGVFLYEVMRRIDPAFESCNFGEALLATDMPSIDTVIREGRKIRKEILGNGK